MNPEYVAAAVALVSAPSSKPSRTMLASRPIKEQANPQEISNSTFSKLFPAHELSRWANAQQPAATIVSPSARITRECV